MKYRYVESKNSDGEYRYHCQYIWRLFWLIPIWFTQQAGGGKDSHVVYYDTEEEAMAGLKKLKNDRENFTETSKKVYIH